MNFSAWIPIVLVILGLDVVSFWHMATHDVPYMPKWAWAVLVIIAPPLGAIVYMAVVMFGAGVQREDAEGRPIDR